MASFLILGNYTEQGIKAIKQSPQRTEEVKQLAQAKGGRMIFFYLTMGQYDFASLLELPDDETAARLLLELGMKGNVRTSTLRAFTEAEYQSIVGGLS